MDSDVGDGTRDFAQGRYRFDRADAPVPARPATAVSPQVRAAVVGGGIIGLAVARELQRVNPFAQVTVFEKESHVAAHQTGHNSGVVHAGLYYEPGSLKARLCRRGSDLLRRYAEDKAVAFEECGKIVVALDDSEMPRLTAIFERATANGVPDVRMIGSGEIRDIEPNAVGVAALYSPHTAIVDYVGIARALADDIDAAGGSILLGHEVTAIDAGVREVAVSTCTGTDRFDIVIACAGLQSDRLAAASGEPADPRIVPFYGDYYLLAEEKESMVNGLIYPVPDPRYPFLGVHLTKRYDGAVLLGPNAFVSRGREAYERGEFSVRDITAAVGFGGFWRFAARNAAAAVREARTAVSTTAFVAEARKYVPDIERGDVRCGPRGIRAQAMHADGRLEDDFVITGTDRLTHVRNAPSPGATSSLAIAEHIVADALRRLEGSIQ